MKQVLKLIASEMKKAGIDYHFMKNKKRKRTYPYFVGELLPADPTTEDGKKEFTLVLDGFNRESETTDGTLFELLEEAEKIEKHFPSVDGLTALVKNQAIAVYFLGCQPVESGDEQLEKVQVNLSIKTWKG
ncbi:hypothetical protein [Parablautia muri]|uniref:Uncharacterized protein n=1 Tax=Parablautia muri TaxID=2320879 RepID=A0A9X5GSS9_9FIRM|nr:hypothetical protein [Parablautia muri]NBJ93205.1 hypothetical protein [Parablautia muri]